MHSYVLFMCIIGCSLVAMEEKEEIFGPRCFGNKPISLKGDISRTVPSAIASSPSTNTVDSASSDEEFSEENGWIEVEMIEPTTPPETPRQQRKEKKKKKFHPAGIFMALTRTKNNN